MKRTGIGLASLVCWWASLADANNSPSPVAKIEAPDWAYPVNPAGATARNVDRTPVRVPDSRIRFLPAQLADLFSAPDWYPTDHPVMPDVVARGRKPDIEACGYCHLPDGAGRPENASLAGLPAAYIEQQVRDFGSGARRTAVPGRLPPKLMTHLSARATDEEIRTAAAYFASLTPRNQIQVIETQTVPGTRVAGWIRIIDPAAPREPIGQRIIEVPVDAEQFEHRDAHCRFIAYVPVGAVAAGKALVNSGSTDRAEACTSCHGADLRGAGAIPGIAGRSPSYIVRQLFDIRSGLRAGSQVAPMAEVARRLSPEQMLQMAAYLATLQ
jgi:cytochrome c553